MTRTAPTTASAYHVTLTCALVTPASRSSARSETKSETTTRNPASASAARCSAFPCPNWCFTSAGRAATRIAKKVSSAATRSVPECAASETRPRLCVASPTASFSTTSAAAAATETSADRRCGVMDRRLERFERPDHDVLAGREEDARLLVRQRDRSHRVQVDGRLAALQVPRRMVDLGAERPAAVLGVEAVALRQELLQRPRLGTEQRPASAVRRAERCAGPSRLVPDVVGLAHAAHLRMVVRQPVEPLGALHRHRARRVEREEPDARLGVTGDVRPHVQLRERGEARQRREPAQPEVREQERRDAEPGAALVRIELQRRRDELAQRARLHAPVQEREVEPGLRVRPGPLRRGPRPVARVVHYRGLPRGGGEEVERQRLPRSACSRSIASNSALKLPSPNPRAPWRSITSKKSVGRSWAVFVKICSR